MDVGTLRASKDGSLFPVGVDHTILPITPPDSGSSTKSSPDHTAISMSFPSDADPLDGNRFTQVAYDNPKAALKNILYDIPNDLGDSWYDNVLDGDSQYGDVVRLMSSSDSYPEMDTLMKNRGVNPPTNYITVVDAEEGTDTDAANKRGRNGSRHISVVIPGEPSTPGTKKIPQRYEYELFHLTCAKCRSIISYLKSDNSTSMTMNPLCETDLSEESEQQHSKDGISTPKGWASAVLKSLGKVSAVSQFLNYFVDNHQTISAKVVNDTSSNTSSSWNEDTYGTNDPGSVGWDEEIYGHNDDYAATRLPSPVKQAWDSDVYAIDSQASTNTYEMPDLRSRGQRVYRVFPCGHMVDDCSLVQPTCAMEASCAKAAKLFNNTALDVTLKQPEAKGTAMHAHLIPALPAERKRAPQGSSWKKKVAVVGGVTVVALTIGVVFASLMSSGSSVSPGFALPSYNCSYGDSVVSGYQNLTQGLQTLPYLNQTGLTFPGLNASSCDTMQTVVNRVMSYVTQGGIAEACKSSLQTALAPLSMLALTQPNLGSVWGYLSGAQSNAMCAPQLSTTGSTSMTQTTLGATTSSSAASTTATTSSSTTGMPSTQSTSTTTTTRPSTTMSSSTSSTASTTSTSSSTQASTAATTTSSTSTTRVTTTGPATTTTSTTSTTPTTTSKTTTSTTLTTSSSMSTTTSSSTSTTSTTTTKPTSTSTSTTSTTTTKPTTTTITTTSTKPTTTSTTKKTTTAAQVCCVLPGLGCDCVPLNIAFACNGQPSCTP